MRDGPTDFGKPSSNDGGTVAAMIYPGLLESCHQNLSFTLAEEPPEPCGSPSQPLGVITAAMPSGFQDAHPHSATSEVAEMAFEEPHKT